MNKNKYNYRHLIGLTKKEVLTEMGDDFNFYPDNTWTYVLRVSWLGINTILFIFYTERQSGTH